MTKIDIFSGFLGAGKTTFAMKDLYEITKLIVKNRLIERINNYEKTVE